MKRSRFDAVEPYSAPNFAINLAERRVGGFVETFNWQQLFSAKLVSAPRPTLIDLVVSAYLQGVDDCALMFFKNGIELPADAANAFNEPIDDRPEINAT